MRPARLHARPSSAAPASQGELRLHVLRVGTYPAYLVDPGAPGPVPLIISLHGAGGHAQQGLERLAREARDARVALLAPESTGGTWDAIHGRFGVDVAAIDEALRQAFALVAVDPARICLAGFSDGASYALGLGLANGDLFTHIAAFSPGFVPGADAVGEPRVFMAHGTADPILPIDRTSRVIVPVLRGRGLAVDYREFDGGHLVPEAERKAAMDWLLST
ncbi:MAG: PHB depolymerase family esterase [Chloroflexota bacterium]